MEGPIEPAEDGLFYCPECAENGTQASFKAAQGLASHRRSMHNIVRQGSDDIRNSKMTLYLNRGDWSLLEFCAEYLGSSRADVARSALRAFATNLQQIAAKQDSK